MKKFIPLLLLLSASAFAAKTSQTITFGQAPTLSIGTTGQASATSTSGLPVTIASTTPTVCTVFGYTVTPLAAGSCVLSGNQMGNATFSAAPQVMQTIAISKGNQTLTWGTVPSTLKAVSLVTATSSSRLPAVFATTSAACTVTTTPVNGIVTPKSVGTCTVTADQPGNTAYNAAAQITKDIQIQKQDQTITFGPAPIMSQSLTSGQLIAWSSSRLTLAFTSATPNVCTVTGTSVTGLVSGTCTVNADQPGDANYNIATRVIQTFVIPKLSQTVTFGPIPKLNTTTSSATLNASASSGLSLAFVSNSPSVCSVSGNTVTGITPGQCVVYAIQGGNGKYDAAQATQQFTVPKFVQTITFTSTATTVTAGSSVLVTAVSSANLGITYGTLTPTVCSTINSGLSVTVSVAGTGTCTIGASQAGNAQYNAAQATKDLTVQVGQQTITFNTITPLIYGTNLTLTPFVSSTSRLPVGVASSTPTICTVSIANILIAKGTGKCVLTAVQGGSNGYAAAPQVTQTVTIVPADQLLSLDVVVPTRLSTKVPTSIPSHSSSMLPTVLTSTTLSICTVKGYTVTGIAPGTCSLTLTQAGNANYNPALKNLSITIQ